MALERIWLLEIEALDALDNPVTLNFASGDYTSPTDEYYEDRLKQPALYTSSAYAGDVIQTGSRSAYGEAVLVNIDGELNYLADYAVDGRALRLKLRDEYGTITTIINGTVESLSFSDKTISVRLRDPQEQLQLEHPQSTYLGNNILPAGLEGTENDLKGQPKPIVYGKVRNAEPFLVNSTQYIYEVHDFAAHPDCEVDIISVYDNGVLITKDIEYTTLVDFMAATIPASKYGKYEGYFKLGTAPSGQITCDVDSDIYLLGDVFEHVAEKAGFTVNSTDVTAFNAFGDVGIYLTTSTTTTALLDLLMQSVGGYWIFEPDNTIRLRQLVAPSSPSIYIEDYAITNISRSSTGAGGNGIPIYEVRLKADKVETIQTDLPAGSADEFRARVGTQYREAISTSSTVKTRHPLSEELTVETALRSLSEAQTQADRLQALLGVRRDSVNLTVRLDEEVTSALDIGVVVNVKSYKLGYSAGKDFLILGYTLNARLSRVELDLWG